MKRSTAVGLVLGAAAAGAALAGQSAWDFARRLDDLELELEESAPAEPRADLPPEVAALAARCGAKPERKVRFAHFAQTGQMWLAPGARPMDFEARQTVSSTAGGFLWRAGAGPFGVVKVADYMVGKRAGLEVRAFGALTLAEEVGSPDSMRAEAIRYLAELAWNPDAILFNHAIDWTVIGERRLKAALGAGRARAEVVLELDGIGLIVGASAADRPRMEHGRFAPAPWRARCWDHAWMDGRMIPLAGEASWDLAGTEFAYWRGRVFRWSAGA